ncbi:aldolase [Bacillus sp. 1NLA3E]|uniref:aldolase n=1 Tax=Bacillus sp. 1NLA3E TaxID=666686 RepID=UPI000247E736|nr:aldolase [Bacillus sp. 1NLA3E]AGK52671.1 2',3'-cyclic-nucleotide 2'-phosphodiesterase [Bacillus sp. 1NLA3E]
MINTLEKVMYKAFGLSITSEILLPELPLLGEQIEKGLADVEIEIGDLSVLWAEFDVPNETFVMKENFVLFQIPDIAIFSVQNGSKVIVSPMASSNEDEIRLFILGTCMGAILLQKKILPLHGSAIVIDGLAYAFVGDSGAGKSTLASAFLHRGYQLLTDDVIAVSLSQDGMPMVAPSYPQQKLWQESLNEFGKQIHQYRPLFERETKFAVPVSSQFTSDTFPLAGVFELVKTESEEIDLRPIKGLGRLHTLYYHTYRNFLLAPLRLMNWHFEMSTQIANQIKLHQLIRPVSHFTAHELPSVILNILQTESNSG